MKEIYVINWLYSNGAQKYNAVVFVSDKFEEAQKHWLRLCKIAVDSYESFELVRRKIDDTSIVDTIIEVANNSQGFAIRQRGRKPSRALKKVNDDNIMKNYFKILERIWRGRK